MRRALLACLFLLGLSTRADAVLPATDFCNDLAGLLSANWTQLTTTGLIYNGSATCGGQTADYQVSLWNADTFNANHSAEGVVAAVGSGQFAGLGVRVTDGSGTQNFPGYYLFVGNAGGPMFVQECTDAVPSVCSTIANYSEVAVTTNTVKIGIVGSQIYVFLEGVVISCDSGSSCAAGVLTSGTFTTGGAAMAAYDLGSFDTWVGDNFTAPSFPSGGPGVGSTASVGAGR